MPVHFTCPHCGQLLSVTRRKVGQPVQCVRCQGGVLVPQPPDFDQSQPASHPSEAYQLKDVVENGAELPTITTAPADVFGGTVEMSRAALYTIGGLIAGVAIVSFLLGWSFGSEMSSQKQDASMSSALRLSGRITYSTTTGKIASDSEAVVVAFPTQRKPDEKFDSTAMRPDVAPTSVSTSLLSAIRTLGGDFARTDRNGAYELELSRAGEYYLLIISNHISRAGARQPTTREIVEMGQFVTRATELLSDNDYVWSKQVVAKSQVFDHVFDG